MWNNSRKNINGFYCCVAIDKLMGEPGKKRYHIRVYNTHVHTHSHGHHRHPKWLITKWEYT